MGTVFLLVKFFNEVSHAADFVNGKIWLNPLSYFKALETNDDSGRADRHEGTIAWLQPDQGRLVIDGIDITEDLAGPIEMQKNWLNSLYVYCLHAVHSGNIALDKLTNDNIECLRSEFKIPDACLSFGKYAVVVKDVPEFVRRIEAVIYAENYRWKRRLVRYYDPDSFHGHFNDMESIFRKQIKYSYQREYRFAIDSGLTSDCPLILDIGDIKDIAELVNSADLNGPDFLGGEITVAN